MTAGVTAGVTADVTELVSALAERRSVLVTGATGFIGRRLCEALAGAGHHVTVLTRDPTKAAGLQPPFRLVTHLDQIPDDAAIDAIVNLAGEPLADGPWTRRKRRRILGSRLRMTRGVVRLIGRLRHRPSVLVSGSDVGWYGRWGAETLTEFDGGKRSFIHRVCDVWEQAARKAEWLGIRVVRLRIGTVLGADGGILVRLHIPFVSGRGEQWMSWIERDDLVRLIAHVIADPRYTGAVNATAPVPVQNAVFARELARVLHHPLWLRLPARLLGLLGGDLARVLLLGGQRVLPDKADAHGFEFRHPTLRSALSAALGRHAANETSGRDSAGSARRPIIPHHA